MKSDISGLLKQLRHEQRRIGEAISILQNLNGAKGRTGRRTMSAAGRKRIAAAQRARWAKIRAGKK
jgi:hypothetical protein